MDTALPSRTTGRGLSDADKERFFRGSNAADSYVEGTGLGLPVVKAIMGAHGGLVQLTDRRGGGLIAAINAPGRSRLKAVS